MSREDIQAATKSELFTRFHSIVPVIYGCVNYHSDFSKGIHQTPFLYQMNPVPITEGTIPPSNLELLKEFKGEGAN
jgi:hypothetical protein